MRTARGMHADFAAVLDACVLAKLAAIANDHDQEFQDILIRLGKSVPAFSRRVLEDYGRWS
jgi:hypothetical protein